MNPTGTGNSKGTEGGPSIIQPRHSHRRSATSCPGLGGRTTPGTLTKSRGAQPDQRFTRRLARLLRNPPIDFLSVLALESRAARPIGDDSERHIVFRVANRLLLAFCRLLLIERWLAFVAERPKLTLASATNQYLALMRRRGITRSRATLYEYKRAFEQRGLAGLVPQWKGGRRSRIPPADRALLRDLFRQGDFYGVYRAARKHARLEGRPITASAARQVMGEFVGSKRAIRRPTPREKGSRV